MNVACLALAVALVAYQGRDPQYQQDQIGRREFDEFYQSRFSDRAIRNESGAIEKSKLWPLSKELANFCEQDHPRRIKLLTKLLAERYDPPMPDRDDVDVLSALIDATRLVRMDLKEPDRTEFLENLIGILERRWAGRKSLGSNQLPAIVSLFDALPVHYIPDPKQRARVIQIVEPAIEQLSFEREWKACRSAVVCYRLIGVDEDVREWASLRAILERTMTEKPGLVDEEEIVEVRRSLIDAFAEFGYGEHRRYKEERQSQLPPDDAARLGQEIDEEDRCWKSIARVLRGFLTSSKVEVRISAATALGHIGNPCAEGAIDALSERLDTAFEREFNVRYASVNALKWIGLNENAVTVLIRSLNDPAPDFRDIAASALETPRRWYIPGVLEAIESGLNLFDPEFSPATSLIPMPNDSPHVRAFKERKKRAERIAVALLAWNMDRRQDERIADRLGDFLLDADPIVRERAGAALTKLGEKAIPRFRKALDQSRPESRAIAIDRLSELSKGLSVDSSKEQFDAVIKLFDEPNSKANILLKASRVLDIVCNNVVDAASQGASVEKVRRSMASSLATASGQLRARGSEYAPVAEALETRQKTVTPIDAKPTTLRQATIDLWNLAYQNYPIASLTVLLVVGLYAACAVTLIGIFVVRPGRIVSFREWVIRETRKKRPNKLIRLVCDFLLQPLSPVRWWNGNSRVLNDWIGCWLPTFRKNLNVEDITLQTAAVAICTGEPCAPVEPKSLDETIANAFAKARSGILILGEDTDSLDWITKYIARWALGDRQRGTAAAMGSAGESDSSFQPMLPVIVSESEFVTSDSPIPDKTLLRHRVRQAIGELIRQNHPAITPDLHADLVTSRKLLVICKAEPNSPAELTALVQLLQQDYKDWVITSRELGAYNSRLFPQRVTMMKVRFRSSEPGRFGCTHKIHHWGTALNGIFETWLPQGEDGCPADDSPPGTNSGQVLV